MKKLFLLISFAATAFAGLASNTVSLVLDYSGNDVVYANNHFTNAGAYLWSVNKRFGNGDNMNLDYAAVFFDTLQYVNGNNIVFIPRASAALTMDSFSVAFIHNHVTNNPDSIRFTLFDKSAAVVTGYGTPAATYTTPKLWDTLIVVNYSIPLNTTNFTIKTFKPGISLPQGKTFGVRMDFSGDTANLFQVVAGYPEHCNDDCAAALSIAGNNSAYYLNYTAAPNQNFSGYYENSGQSTIFYDCDQSNGYTIGACENFNIQTFQVTAYMRATVNYGAQITADSLKGCPGTTLNLNANAYGSNATPFTYNWATTSGSLGSTSDQQVDLVIGNSNAVVTVTVTDANNQTTTATVTVLSKGINVNMTSANPLMLNCGSSSTITTQISGTTTGKIYLWNTGATGTGVSTIQVNSPGTYTVTVTNNQGCSASASLNVIYPNGLTNTISFVLPIQPVCEDQVQFFTNTSAQQNGWNYQWSFGDGNIGFVQNGNNTYANPGVYTVRLQQDSAGCVFVSPTQNLTVLAASNGLCLANQPPTVNLGNNQTVCTGAFVTLNAPTNGGVSPYTYQWGSTGDTLSCTNCASPSVHVTQTSTISVTVTDANNHTATDNVVYNVSSNTLQLTPNGPTTFCQGGSVTLQAGSGYTQYHWSNNATGSAITVSTGGIYSVTATTSNNCTASASVTITVNAATISNYQISPNGPTTFCNGGSVTLSAGSGFTGYHWSTGSSAQTITVSASGTYYVSATGTDGCIYTDNQVVSTNSTFSGQQVCIVTVDALTGKNVVVWEKSGGFGVDSFKVFRETSTAGVYQLIRQQAFGNFSTYEDAQSNPQQVSNRYVITTVDACGESGYSAAHKTIHLTSNQGINNEVNLIWNAYEGFNYPTFNIYRGNQPGSMQLLTSVSSGTLSYTDLTPPSPPLYYQIEVVNPLGCVPTAKNSDYSTSLSNIIELQALSADETAPDVLSAYNYYNETEGSNMLHVNFNRQPSGSLKLYDLSGRTVFTVSAIVSNEIRLPVTLARGIYIADIAMGSSNFRNRIFVR